MITNLHKNIMVTTSFDAAFPTFRKAQDFIVYPLTEGQTIEVQSDKRFGTIDLTTGAVVLSESKSNANSITFAMSQIRRTTLKFALPSESLEALKAHIKSTSGHSVGELVKCDNSGAAAII